MTKQDIIAQCNKFGEFYIHYEKLEVTGNSPSKNKDFTYLQGTMEFDESQDKYLAKRFKQENIRPADENSVLVFSRTNNSFRYIPVAKIRRITSLTAELDRASKLTSGRRKG